MGHHRERYRDDCYSSDSDDYGPPIVVERQRSRVRDITRTKSRERSRSAVPRERRSSPENIIINNRLNVPGGFPASEAPKPAPAQPIVLVPQLNVPQGEHSHRSRSRHRRYYEESDSSRSRSRGRGKNDRPLDIKDMPYEVRREIERLRDLEIELKKQGSKPQPALPAPKKEDDEYSRWKKEREYEKGREYERARERERELEEERAKLKERERYDKWERERERERDREDRDERDRQRQIRDAKDKWQMEQDAAARDAKQKMDDYKRMLEEQEREDQRKREEYKRMLADKAKAEADEKKRIAEEMRLAEEKKALARKEEEDRIIREHEEKLKRKKKEEEELRERILREEEERRRQEAEKKRKEEEEFEEKVRMRALKNGWSDEYVEELLHNINKGKRRHRSRSRENHDTSIVVINNKEKHVHEERPTWIKINRKFILPETLEAYGLKWGYDPDDDDFILIKQYVDHDLQKALFAHTKTIIERRKTITEGYVRETTTTLRPNEGRSVNVVKGKDRMYLVRNKSRSPAPERRRMLL